MRRSCSSNLQKLDHLDPRNQLLHHVNSSIPSCVGSLLNVDVSDVEPSLDRSGEEKSEETDCESDEDANPSVSRARAIQGFPRRREVELLTKGTPSEHGVQERAADDDLEGS